MKTAIKQIYGAWNEGYALDKHTVSSVAIGTNAYGHTEFKTIRTEVGEALYQLKYQQDWSQVDGLATELAAQIYPRFHQIGLVIPMPPSKQRERQPVAEIASALGEKINKPCFENMLIKSSNGKSLKDIKSREEKMLALTGTLTYNDVISKDGKWNALLIDDIYDTGATLDAACAVLKTYPKIANIYIATLTWK